MHDCRILQARPFVRLPWQAYKVLDFYGKECMSFTMCQSLQCDHTTSLRAHLPCKAVAAISAGRPPSRERANPSTGCTSSRKRANPPVRSLATTLICRGGLSAGNAPIFKCDHYPRRGRAQTAILAAALRALLMRLPGLTCLGEVAEASSYVGFCMPSAISQRTYVWLTLGFSLA
eukprot:82252-Chlamydomonas_euryale.AAC.5